MNENKPEVRLMNSKACDSCINCHGWMMDDRAKVYHYCCRLDSLQCKVIWVRERRCPNFKSKQEMEKL